MPSDPAVVIIVTQSASDAPQAPALSASSVASQQVKIRWQDAIAALRAYSAIATVAPPPLLEPQPAIVTNDAKTTHFRRKVCMRGHIPGKPRGDRGCGRQAA